MPSNLYIVETTEGSIAFDWARKDDKGNKVVGESKENAERKCSEMNSKAESMGLQVSYCLRAVA